MISPVGPSSGIKNIKIKEMFPGHTKAGMEAVTQNFNLKYASLKLRADREVGMAAVKNNGYALEYASLELRADREVVMEAVKQDGGALLFASEKLQADEDVVMEAVINDGNALVKASRNLRANRQIILAAITQNPDAIMYAEYHDYITDEHFNILNSFFYITDVNETQKRLDIFEYHYKQHPETRVPIYNENKIHKSEDGIQNIKAVVKELIQRSEKDDITNTTFRIIVDVKKPDSADALLLDKLKPGLFPVLSL
jgi:hypothetical protein